MQLTHVRNRRCACARFDSLIGLVTVILLTTITWVDIASAQPAYQPERLDDRPGIPTAQAGGAAPRSGPVIFGPYASVQVNVNAQGANVVGDAANEPSLVIDPTNPMRMAIAWRQFDTIASNFRQAGNAYSTDGGASWTFPGVLEPGQFRSDPVLAADAAGNFYYSSLSSETSAEMFKSTNGGMTWTGPVNAFGGDKQWIAVDRTGGIGDGNVYQIWNRQFSCCGVTDFTRSINGAASFEAPLAIPEPSLKWGTLDVGPDGTLYVVGATLNQQSHLFQKSTTAQDPMQTPTFASEARTIDLGGPTVFATGPNPGGLLGQVWLATDHSPGPQNGNIYVLASVNPAGDDPLDVMFIRSSDGGDTWTTPIRVNHDQPAAGSYQWFGTMSVAPNGRIDAVWNHTQTNVLPVRTQTRYTYSIDAGARWAPSVAITPPWDQTLGYPNQNKIGDYYHMISDTNGANLAYAATFNGEQDVFFIRIVEDCNGNGIHDGTDLLSGTSSDCNGNLAPDECEALSTSINGMVIALLKPSEHGENLCLFDVNDDGQVDGRDIEPFVTQRLLP